MRGPSNKPFGRWDEVFGDDVVAAAMIDRLVHHADVVNLFFVPRSGWCRRWSRLRRGYEQLQCRRGEFEMYFDI